MSDLDLHCHHKNDFTMIAGNTSLEQYFKDFLVAYNLGAGTGEVLCDILEVLPFPPYYVVLYDFEEHAPDEQNNTKIWNRAV